MFESTFYAKFVCYRDCYFCSNKDTLRKWYICSFLSTHYFILNELSDLILLLNFISKLPKVNWRKWFKWKIVKDNLLTSHTHSVRDTGYMVVFKF